MITFTIDRETAIEEVNELKRIISEITPTSIYDDVTELQNKVAHIEELLINGGYLKSAATGVNNRDLNTCVGEIIIGYGNECTNRPINQNGYFINIPHDSKPTLYGKQIYITRQSNSIYMRNLENGAFSTWVTLRHDTGWVDLPLKTGISAYSSAQFPQYRRINNTVYIRGAVKGITGDKTIIGTLPSGYRPTKVVSFVQNMSMHGGLANIARWQVQLDGDIEMQYTDHPFSELSGDDWFALDASFLND